MIEGIKIELTSDELRSHVQSRVDFHRAKCDFYAKQAASLRAGQEENAATYNASNNPVASLQQSEASHRERATYFKILADHLIPGETYRLSDTDLTRLELFSRYFI
jgi:hypothetical protein